MNLHIFNNVLKVVKNPTVGKVVLTVRKHLPDICLWVGAASEVGAVVATGVQTSKLEPVLDDHKKRMDILKEKETDEKTLRVQTAKEYAKTTGKMAKLYALPAALEGVSMACRFGGHHCLKSRYTAAVGAYMGVSEAFRAYRDRVVEKEGEEADKEYMGPKTTTEVVTDEEGNVQEQKVVVMNNHLSIYARLFDAGNENWSKNAEMNMAFLKSQQIVANTMLHDRGFLFLNEVYDLLDIPRSEAGQYVGWVEGMGDDFVDFGLYTVENKNATDGFEPAIWLDFNVDGDIMYIFDKLHGGDGKHLVNYMGRD